MNRPTISPRGTLEITPCERCPLAALPAFRALAGGELEFVRHLKVGEVHLAPGESVLYEGETTDTLYTVLSGWGFRAKSLADGRRQILNFVLPGDLIGLQSSLFEEAHHSVEAVTELGLCVFPRSRLWSLYSDHPGLALDVTWLAARQEFVLDENLTSVGRRSARERLAHLIAWLYHRAEQVGLATDHEIPLPLTQQHIADALGLSLVHTNKTLKRLARDGIVLWTRGRLKLLDWPALIAAARWEPSRKILRPYI